MKKLFLFTATAALILAAPSAFAAPHDKGGEHGGHGGHGGGAAHSAPAKAAHAPKAAGAHMGHSAAAPAAAARTGRGNRSHGMATTTASPSLGATPSHGRNQLHMSDVARANAAHNANRNTNNRNSNNRNTNDRNNITINNRNNNRGNDSHANRGNGRGNNHSDFNRRNVSAQHHYHYRGGAYRGPSGYSYRRWAYGESLPSIYFTQNYWISDYSEYGLQYPPEGTVWVRYGDDALLIDQYSGEILEVVYGQFY